MQLIEWKNEFSLGIPGVDYEHRELICLINDLLKRMAVTDVDPDVTGYLGEIYTKIALHFALEEKVMRQKNYDQLAEHKADHDRLLDDIRDIMDEYESNSDIDLDRFADRLGHWFSDHFQTMDARLHKHLDK